MTKALQYSHTKAKVVHRDLKPANLMVDAQGDVKIADFGIAASVSDSVSRVSKQAGSSGTPVYMSPQQMMGERPAVTDDIYAIGATLYELLTGKPPFYTGNVFMQVQSKVPPSIAERRKELEVAGDPVPAAWEETIAACLAKDPSGRPQSAAEVAERLGLKGMATGGSKGAETEDSGRKLEEQKVEAGPALAGTGSERVPATAGPRSTSKTGLYAGIAAAVILLGGLGWYFGIHAPEQKRLAEIARLEAEGRAAEALKLKNEQERKAAEEKDRQDKAAAAAKEQADREQREYAVILAKIDAVLDGSPASLRAQTGAAVKDYLASAPDRFRAEVEGRWATRSAGWEVAVKKEEERIAAAKLAAARGGISIRTNPPGAEVRVGAVALDKSPLTLKDQKLGKYPVRVRLDGYEEWTGEVEVKENEFADLDVALTRSTGTLIVTSSPSGAAILRDGQEIGRTPFSKPAMTGAYRLSLQLRGYKPAEVSGEVARNTELRLGTSLEKIRGAEPGQAWTIPELNLTMQPIAPGTFSMGSASGGDSDERPVTRVTLTKPFWLGKTEVTQAQWSAVMGSNPSRFKGAELPVENVSWDDAMEFCRKVTERERAAGRLPEGYAYTLPTEAQWEYACRAGTTGDYAGNLDSMGWYGSNSGNQTKPVGTKQANAWGPHDMHGNVWEWCADWKGEYPGGSVTDPAGSSSGSHRVGRGGSWGVTAGRCRSAVRGGVDPGYRGDYLGFRLSLSSVR